MLLGQEFGFQRERVAPSTVAVRRHWRDRNYWRSARTEEPPQNPARLSGQS
jgi:hypothetical protein